MATANPTKLLYVIAYRARNIYRKKNLHYVLEWIKSVKKQIDQKKLVLDILIVDQESTQPIEPPSTEFHIIQLINVGLFNKGWGFNVAVKQYPSYDYYAFADADIIIPDVPMLCGELIEHCVNDPKPAFRPFNDRMDTETMTMQQCTGLDHLLKQHLDDKLKLTKHLGLSFAANLIVMTRKIFEEIGGWDESFRGWGRYDDFLAHKLAIISQCSTILSPTPAIHLWHPITLDFSLNRENIQLYDKYITYSRDDLVQLINSKYASNGDPQRFSQVKR